MAREIHPFIGENYKKGINGNKILIMGESSWHNGTPTTPSMHTIYLANDAIGYNEGKGYWNKGRFYTRSARIFGFNTRDFTQRKIFWNSVAYYNFLQVIFQRPKIEPSPAHWEEGKIPFLETLEELNPDYIISFSKRMWSYLPKKIEEQDIANKYGIFAKRSIIEGSMILGFMHTASFGFKWEYVKDILDKQIN